MRCRRRCSTARKGGGGSPERERGKQPGRRGKEEKDDHQGVKVGARKNVSPTTGEMPRETRVENAVKADHDKGSLGGDGLGGNGNASKVVRRGTDALFGGEVVIAEGGVVVAASVAVAVTTRVVLARRGKSGERRAPDKGTRRKRTEPSSHPLPLSSLPPAAPRATRTPADIDICSKPAATRVTGACLLRGGAASSSSLLLLSLSVPTLGSSSG